MKATWVTLVWATLMLACSATTTTPPKTVRKDAAMTEAQSPAGDKHPGEIVFEDKVEHSTHTKRATEVPASIAWVQLDAVWVPVVKIVITGAGQTREMTKYGPDDRFLATTTATLGPPRK
jgi:hypothetical protein